MTPAINQMIAWLDGEMNKYPATGQSFMDKGYRVLGQARVQALKIEARCKDRNDADGTDCYDAVLCTVTTIDARPEVAERARREQEDRANKL